MYSYMSENNQEQLTCQAHTNSDDFSRAKAWVHFATIFES